MEEINSTYTTGKETKPLTSESLLEAISLIKPYEEPTLPNYKPSIFEKLMNKMGWYRKYKVYLIDMQKLKQSFAYGRYPKIEEKKGG